MNHVVDFDIDEYEDIPIEHKTKDLGYIIQSIGSFYIVGFINDDKTMYKIQIVCKIEHENISVIDHVLEMIILIPNYSDIFSNPPSGDAYEQGSFNIIELNNKQIPISKYNTLIDDNINAYISRKSVYGSINETEFIHKSINHIARLFYLYELFYRNMQEFNIHEISMLFLVGMKTKSLEKIEYLNYYKIIDGIFHHIKIETKLFLNAYLELIILNKYLYGMFNLNKKNENYFMKDMEKVKEIHDSFVDRLFDNTIFEILNLDNVENKQKIIRTNIRSKINSSKKSLKLSKRSSRRTRKKIIKN
jgi:hypothetical protein